MRLERLIFQNFLSFGGLVDIPLASLNVLIGPNGSGKSNLIDGISLLRASPRDIQEPIREGGGVSEWIRKPPDGTRRMSIGAVVERSPESSPLRHVLEFLGSTIGFVLREEVVDPVRRPQILEPGLAERYEFDPFEDDPGWFMVRRGSTHLYYDDQAIEMEGIDSAQSILSQIRDTRRYPQLADFQDFYASIAIYREWQFGRNSVYRGAQRTDLRTDKLEEDFSNLALFFHKFKKDPVLKKRILAALRDFNASFDDFDVAIEGGSAQIFFTEGKFTIPATRLSDGTLRYLCLLAILLDPKPPALICLEEPELGLHPDIIPKIADMLIEASERTQLIVTTHSDILVDALSEVPESVVICEKEGDSTVMRRLKKEELSDALEKYRLGQLWTRGDLGGNRW